MNKIYKHFLKNYVFTQKKYFILVCCVTVLQSFLSTCIPLTSRELLDNAFPNRNMSLFIQMVAAMLTCYFIVAGLNVSKDYLLAKIAETISLKLRTQLNNKISVIKYSYFDEHNLSEVLSKFNKEVDTVKENCGYMLVKTLSNVVTFIMKSCVATIFGIDGLVNDKISEAERIINGTIDKEKFLSGNYVIAQGYISDSGNSELQPTYDVGDTVVINDREFEVMAIVEAPYPVTEGKINPGSEFSMSFFVSAGDFLEMFPENTPRKLFLNIEESKIQDVETENTIQEHYMNETKSATFLQNLVCIMLLIIGTVNLINVIITSTTARKKEFAMMQSIGMTKKQLRCLLVMEGLNISIITLIISYFLSMVIISTVLKSYLATQWTATYHFSIMPLLALTPFLILLPVIVSIICLYHMQKTDIIDRLQGGR